MLFNVYEFYGSYEGEELLLGQTYTHVGTCDVLDSWAITHNPFRAEMMAKQVQKYRYLDKQWRGLTAKICKVVLPGDIMAELVDKDIHCNKSFLQKIGYSGSEESVIKAFLEHVRDDFNYYYQEVCHRYICTEIDQLAEKIAARLK